MSSETPAASVGKGSIIDDFEIMEQVGAGAFSHVHIAKHIPTNNYCAAKIIELGKMSPEEFTGMIREVSVFMQVDHPNICNLYRLSVSEENLIFFMEFAPRGTLLDYVNAKGGLKEFEAQRLFIQIFDGLRHLHLYHFLVHRDLKLENILIDGKGNMKITDFGLSGTFYNNILRTFVGTAGYQPPEILAGSEYDEKCDVWSLGVCLYAMLTASLPFNCKTQNFRTLIQEASTFQYPKTFSPMLVDLLKKMFEVRPNERPTLIQLQNHPWLKGLQQLGTNIAPQPIMFYKVNNARGILKFRRRTIKPDPKIIEKCSGIDAEQLSSDLKNGITNPNTVTYFFNMRPLATKPEMLAPPPPPPPTQPATKPPLIPGARKQEMPKDHSIPGLSATLPVEMKLSALSRKSSVPAKGPSAMAKGLRSPSPTVVSPSVGGKKRPGTNRSVPVIAAPPRPVRKQLPPTGVTTPPRRK